MNVKINKELINSNDVIESLINQFMTLACFTKDRDKREILSRVWLSETYDFLNATFPSPSHLKNDFVEVHIKMIHDGYAMLYGEDIPDAIEVIDNETIQ